MPVTQPASKPVPVLKGKDRLLGKRIEVIMEPNADIMEVLTPDVMGEIRDKFDVVLNTSNYASNDRILKVSINGLKKNVDMAFDFIEAKFEVYFK